MPWVALQDGEKTIPAAVDDGTQVECIDCGGDMYPREHRDPDGARHFYHPGGSSGCSAIGGGGESDVHLKMKTQAVSRLSDVFGERTVECVPEKKLEVSEDSENDHRVADAYLEFDERDEQLGRGIIAEVQYRNEGKDIEATTEDYVSQGFSVAWLYEDDFSDDRCILDEEDLRERAQRSVWPDYVPEGSEWRSEKYDYANIHARWREAWESGLCESGAPAVLPTEWYGKLARMLFRDTPWHQLFGTAVCNQNTLRRIGKHHSQGRHTTPEGKIPFLEWVAEERICIVVGKECEISNVISAAGDATPRGGRKLADLHGSEIAASVPISSVDIDGDDRYNHRTLSPEFDQEISVSGIPDESVLIELSYYISEKTAWRSSTWEDLFPGTLETPINDPSYEGPSSRTGEVPFGTWFASDPPSEYRLALKRSYALGRDERPNIKKNREEALERIPRVIEYNTGNNMQPDTIAKHNILTIAHHANIPCADWAIEQLVEDGRVVETDDGRYRLAEDSNLDGVAGIEGAAE